MTRATKRGSVARHAAAAVEAGTTTGTVDLEQGAPSALEPPEPARRRHLEGFAYYFVAVPCWIVVSIAVLLFVDAFERYIYGDD